MVPAATARLLVRHLDPRLVAALKARAARHGRSAEAEHRDILTRALLGEPPPTDFKSFLRSMPDVPGLNVARSRDRGRRIRL